MYITFINKNLGNPEREGGRGGGTFPMCLKILHLVGKNINEAHNYMYIEKGVNDHFSLSMK